MRLSLLTILLLLFATTPSFAQSLELVERMGVEQIKVVKMFGSESFSSHSARHTFAKQLKDMDFTYEQIQQSLNHASLKSTKEYIDTRFDNGVAKNVAKARYHKRRSL